MLGTGGDMSASLCGAADFDTRLTVYTGGCGALECIVEEDDTCGNAKTAVSWASTFNQEYLILVHGFDATLALEVEGQRALVAVGRREDWRPAATRVAEVAGQVSVRGLDLDHVRAQVSEDAGADRPGDHLAHVDDAIARADSRVVVVSPRHVTPPAGRRPDQARCACSCSSTPGGKFPSKARW